MYEVREGRITTDFLPKIKCYKNTTCSIMEFTRENLKFEISPGRLFEYLRYRDQREIDCRPVN